jgi:hypothetical protein
MSTREQLGEVSAIRQAECRHVLPQNQSLTTRMFAAIIASALVLPAIGAVIDASSLGSPALSLLGFVFLIGFGVPYYVFLHWALEEDIASETESGQNLPTRIIDEPPKRTGGLLVMVLEGQQALLEFGEGGEVIGREDLTLDDGEIDLNLVEPAGVDRGVDQHDRGPRRAQAVGSFFAAVGGTVICNPEDAPRRAIGFNRHNLVYEAVKWLDAGGVLAAAEELGAMNIPGGQVRARTAALVFLFNAGAAARCCGQRGMYADARLDAGFLVRRQDKVTAAQRRTFPAALVKVKHATGLHGEIGIAREDPAAVSPRAQRFAAEPAPQGGVTDLRHDTFAHDLTLNVGQRPARQGQAAAMGQFAHQRLNRDDDAGGKSGRGPRRGVPPPAPGSHVHRSACAICSRSGAAYPGATR